MEANQGFPAPSAALKIIQGLSSVNTVERGGQTLKVGIKCALKIGKEEMAIGARTQTGLPVTQSKIIGR